MSKRKAISTRTRFEIFKRDGFRCVYCGTTPTDGPLHVDHVEAVANGGSDDPSNLVTACDRCNLGKSSVPLDEHRVAVGDPARAREHAEQIRQFMSAQKELAAAKQEATKQLIDLWCSTLGVDEYHHNLDATLPKALNEFGMVRLMEAISIVASRRSDWAYKRDAYERDIKYFYGILRRWREPA